MHKNSILFLAFLTGFASLLYQTYAIHVVFQFFPKGSDTVALSIAAFLSGLGISAILFSKLTQNSNAKARKVIIISQVILIALSIICYLDLETFANILKSIERSNFDLWLYNILIYTLIWMYLFLPALLLGGCFPVIISLHQRDFKKRFDEVGTVYFYDILGAVIGSLITGFFLIPHIGLEITILVAIAASLLTILFMLERRTRLYFAIFSAISLIIGYTAINNNAPSVKPKTTEFEANDITDERFGNVVFEEPSYFGTVRVAQFNDRKKLFIDYRSMCSIPLDPTKNFGKDGEDLLALITLNNLSKGSDILGIGLGCGFTAGHIARHPHTQSFDLVEINPVIVEAYKNQFAQRRGSIFDLDHVNLTIDDGAKILRKTNKVYDSVIIDIEESDIIHSSPIYTRDYFEIAKKRLKKDGIFSVWSFYVNEDFSKVLYNTLSSVFSYVEFFPRTNSRGAVFFASEREINIDEIHATSGERKIDTQAWLDQVKKEAVINSANQEINTLRRPNLRKYYNSYDFFDIPRDFKDKSIIAD